MEKQVLPQKFQVGKDCFLVGGKIGSFSHDLQFAQADPCSVCLRVCGLQRSAVVFFESGDAPDLQEFENGSHEVCVFDVFGDVPCFLQCTDGELADPRQELFEFFGAFGAIVGFTRITIADASESEFKSSLCFDGLCFHEATTGTGKTTKKFFLRDMFLFLKLLNGFFQAHTKKINN